MTDQIHESRLSDGNLRAATPREQYELAAHFTGSHSGISISYFEDTGFAILPPSIEITDTDEELIAWGRDRHQLTDEELTDERRAQTVAQMRWLKRYDVVGGYGITDRDMTETAMECPSLSSALSMATGKVIVLGAGLSELGLVLSEMHRDGQLTDVPVLADLFDYRALLLDLEALRHEFHDRGLEFPREVAFQRCAAIVAAVEAGNLLTTQHIVGGHDPAPAALHGADLAINVFGPPRETLDSQLELLADGGVLFASQDLSRTTIPAGFTYIPDARRDYPMAQGFTAPPASIVVRK